VQSTRSGSEISGTETPKAAEKTKACMPEMSARSQEKGAAEQAGEIVIHRKKGTHFFSRQEK
jgi:hypothetical protein